MAIDTNDPRLTAYALGELPESEREAFEALLADDAGAQQEIESIRQSAAGLAEELASDEPLALTDDQRNAIAQEAGKPGRPRLTLLRKLTLVTGAAAACVLVAGLLLPLLSEPREKSRRIRSSGNIKQTGLALRMESGDRAPSVSLPPPGSGPKASPKVDGRDLATRIDEASKSSHRPWRTGATDVSEETVLEVSRSVATPKPTKALSPRVLDINGAVAALLPPPTVKPADPMWGDRDGPKRATGMDDGPNREAYDRIRDNPFMAVRTTPVSTFSIDVDTASYANMRRFLNQGRLPPKDAVRIEEMINYFTYDYSQPDNDRPFSINVELAGCPWERQHRLARIGLKGVQIDPDERPASNLVFLLDVSGSMGSPNKLPLLKQAMKMLTANLTENDRVAIAVYAGASGLVLPPTSASRKHEILGALDRLSAGGSTNGGAGIELAYATAAQNFIKGGTNRVILATDGDFNVGVSSRGDLTRLIEEKAKSGVFLTVLGFGMGNYQDAQLEELADKGNGNYAYIDTAAEARKVLVDQIGGTLVTIAKDVKIQIEFNSAQVEAYRLIGYENRLLRAEDFNDDTKDAGEIGAGHTVTALYQIVPKGVRIALPGVDPLKYQTPAAATHAAYSDELMTVKIRYKAPDGEVSKLIEGAVRDTGAGLATSSRDFRFAASVAAFGMVLRDSPHKGTADLGAILDLATDGAERDPHGYRREFIELVRKAQGLQQR
ncbi:MAG: DUF3520 domain-containing protein [Lentisphaerae bacterium]|jgi:Ca-activated chloride channel homolog|nr:DUF3520 domain-containing protein [Lentisphaerota bacterium]MBT5610975.1 DUF3520 domain-containing protein [Lentisphaerota bacterium]MBT7059919.1 DUF3520 domain-containing protein [Lentisphaerota bacterium]MBT7848071.1 DUF3520 domain-containing protein [Lentisphaerota bacterium]